LQWHNIGVIVIAGKIIWSFQGMDEVQHIAQVAADYGVKPARIIHSGKQKALQTAEIMAAALHPKNGIAAVDVINPMDDAIVSF
jgi:phosphohistidine phosphatase